MPSILTRPGGGGGVSASLAITFYSDAGLTTPITTANYGQTIYINAVATGVTPNSHSFALTNGTKSRSYIQAGATLAWTVDIYGSVSVRASATDGSVGTSVTDGSVGTSVTASSTLTVSIVKNALSFDGVNDSADSTLMYDLSQQDHSISFWHRFITYPTGAITSALFSIETYRSSGPALGMTYSSYTGRMQLVSYPNNANQTYTFVPSSYDNDYHFFVITYDFSGQQLKVYRDGVLVLTGNSWVYNTGTWGSIIMAYNSLYPFQSPSRGNCDEKDIRIHNECLSLATIQAMYADDTVMSGNEVQWFAINEPIGQTTGKIKDIITDSLMSLNNMISPYGIVAG